MIVVGDMKSGVSVCKSSQQSGMASRPLLIWDEDCSFCRMWIEHFETLTKGHIGYAPLQEVGNKCPMVTRDELESSVHLLEKDGQIVSGARAVFGALACTPGRGWLLWFYRRLPGLAIVSERLYRFVGAHRDILHCLSVFLLGSRTNQRF